MGCGASIPMPTSPIKFRGKYAKVTVDERQINLTVCRGTRSTEKMQPLEKIEIKKYRNAFGNTLDKVEQRIFLGDGLSTEVLSGDTVSIPYMLKDTIATHPDMESGMETHVVLYPHNEPPERFVVGYGDEDWTYRVRYDDPSRTAVLNHSPKKMPKLLGSGHPGTMKERRQQLAAATDQRSAAATEASQDWQSLPSQVLH